jgi:hypothetical protein
MMLEPPATWGATRGARHNHPSHDGARRHAQKPTLLRAIPQSPHPTQMLAIS